jgi:S-formylglutathione hydrolase FrmB
MVDAIVIALSRCRKSARLVTWGRRPTRLEAASRCAEGNRFVADRSHEITQCFQYGVARPVMPGQRGIIAIMPNLTRRAILRMGVGASAGAAGVWALSALLDPLEPQAATLPQAPAPFEPSAAGSNLANKLTGSFISAARGGVKTNWVIALPPGQNSQSGSLRPVIALHGKDGNANMVIDCGVEKGLAQLVKDGKPPFAVVGVDGGSNSYWHRRASGEDPGAMVLDELLPMLSSMGFDTSRVGFMGWSMGGYGALHLGAKLGPSRTAGICAISPALYTSFTGSAPGAFDSYDDWVQNSVIGLPALSQTPLRVDCGTGDRFYFATRQFVNQLKKPPAGGFSDAGHDMEYWRAQLPGELAWMAS